jgi:transglutaminase-like putative cysteine protease
MRRIILLVIAFVITACAAPTEQNTIASTRSYQVTQTVELLNYGEGTPEKQNLWVALIRSIPPYQEVQSRQINPSNYTLLEDEYGNEYAEFDFSDHPPGTKFTVEIEYEISVNEIVYDLGYCQGESVDGYTQPELHIEANNPQIVDLANELSRRTDCESSRAFYDYVGDNLIYRYNRNDWGAQATFGLMGADCTEYTDLMITLCRAEGIPARYYEGLVFLQGNTNELADTEHAWLDVYLPGVGWVAMDPTMGRFANERDLYFAHHTADHIIVTEGRSPSTLRGSSYLTHLYWPGDSTKIKVSLLDWKIVSLD